MASTGSAAVMKAKVGAAAGTGEGEDLVDAGEEAGPAGVGGGELWRVWQVGGAATGSAGRRRQVVACGAGSRVARRRDGRGPGQ
jgi:hypothetical protein